jgi:hypothetical protein
VSGPYKVGVFGPYKDYGVSGPAGSEHSEHWSRLEAAKMAVRLNSAHSAAEIAERARLRAKVEAMGGHHLRGVLPKDGAPFDDRPAARWYAATDGFKHALSEVLALLGAAGSEP